MSVNQIHTSRVGIPLVGACQRTERILRWRTRCTAVIWRSVDALSWAYQRDLLVVLQPLPFLMFGACVMQTDALYQPPFRRHKTRVVAVGNVAVGGENPIVVQSMTTPDTNRIVAILNEIHRLEEAGCELVRVTVPKPEDAAVLSEIKRHIR